MKIPLSKRLRACCDFIHAGERVADIGTDHGYLAIWLLTNGIARSVIAADIVPGPLSAARRNAERFGCADKMEFYLSDGVQAVPQDFDTMVCAGMGAETMISILKAAPWLRNSSYRLVLQCQTKTALLRRYLSEQGFTIQQEVVLQDGHFLYTVMEAIYHPSAPLTPGQWFISPALLQHPGSELSAYYSWIMQGLVRIISAKGDHADPDMVAALNELQLLSNDHAIQLNTEEQP